MKPSNKNLIILWIFFLLFVTLTLPLFAKYSPHYQWKETITPHFRIYYPEGLERQSAKMRIVAENVYKKLTPLIGWEPEQRTDIVLVDNTDFANGLATPFPHNTVILYIARPALDDSLNNFDQWLEFVFMHEYTHILNMDSIYGLASCTRIFPGRCLFPNAFIPVWQIEGNALLYESLGGRFGRNNSTYTDMVFRTEILKGTFKSITEASTYPRRWPRGRVPYLYGGRFIQYLEDTYGEGLVAKVFRLNGAKVLPFSDNILPYTGLTYSTWETVFGRELSELWQEWHDFTAKKYREEISRIKKEGISSYKALSAPEENALYPRFSPEGDTIYYVSTSPKNDSRLKQYSLKTKKRSSLTRVHSPSSLTTGPKGAPVLTDMEIYGNWSYYLDPYIYKKGYSRLKKRARAHYIDYSASGKFYVYVHFSQGEYSLIKTDTSFKRREYIIKSSGVQLASPAISPRGNRVVITMKGKDSNSDIVLVNLKTKSLQRLTSDKHHDIHPAWHPDGKRILFSSDRNGVYNLYEYRLEGTEKGQSRRLTNMLGGAFSPSVRPGGKEIVFSSYHSRGHRISLMKYPEKERDRKAETITAIDSGYFASQKPANLPERRDYSPLFSVYPPFIMPLLYSEEMYDDRYDWAGGFFTIGWDALSRHMYYISAAALKDQKRAVLEGSYTYSGLYPDLYIGYFDDALFFGDDEFPFELEQEETYLREMSRQIYGGIDFSFLAYNYSHIFSLSYTYQKDYIDIYQPDLLLLLTGEIYLGHSRVSYLFDNTKYYLYSISPERGRSLMVSFSVFREEIKSDIDFERGLFEYSEYLPGIWDNCVLMARVRAGALTTTNPFINNFSLGRYEKGNNGSPDIGIDTWGIRGYPAGLERGNRLFTAAAEYRFPLLQYDWGYRTVPIMFRDLHMVIFGETGNIWYHDTLSSTGASKDNFRKSAGAELHLTLRGGYALDFTGYIGYARGFDETGEDQVYFAVSTFMEGALSKPASRRGRRNP